MKQYNMIMLDFDGTLVNSDEAVNNALAVLIEKYRFPSTSPKYLKHRQGKNLFEKIRIALFLLKIKDEFKDLYGQNIHRVEFYPGIANALAEISLAYNNVVILSSNDSKNISKFMELKNIPPETACIIPSKGLFGKHRTIKAFAKKHGVPLSSILYIGDELRDIKACNKAGVDIAFANWGVDKDEDLTLFTVKYVLNHPSELVQLWSK